MGEDTHLAKSAPPGYNPHHTCAHNIRCTTGHSLQQTETVIDGNLQRYIMPTTWEAKNNKKSNESANTGTAKAQICQILSPVMLWILRCEGNWQAHARFYPISQKCQSSQRTMHFWGAIINQPPSGLWPLVAVDLHSPDLLYIFWMLIWLPTPKTPPNATNVLFKKYQHIHHKTHRGWQQVHIFPHNLTQYSTLANVLKAITDLKHIPSNVDNWPTSKAQIPGWGHTPQHWLYATTELYESIRKMV